MYKTECPYSEVAIKNRVQITPENNNCHLISKYLIKYSSTPVLSFLQVLLTQTQLECLKKQV